MKLEINNLSKSYDEVDVLDNISVSFENDKIYGILGRNGSGKTTFFNSINKDVDIDSGNFFLMDNNKKKVLDSDDIGYVVSTPLVPEFLTAREFLKFFLDINSYKIDELKTIDEYFDMVKINKNEQNMLLKNYSDGMKNKMQFLINIILNPKVILLDEPLISLDIVIQQDMKELLRKLRKDHIIILSTHILELALDLCDEIFVLSGRKLKHISKKGINNSQYKNAIIKELQNG